MALTRAMRDFWHLESTRPVTGRARRCKTGRLCRRGWWCSWLWFPDCVWANSGVSSAFSLVLIAITTLAACVTLGGGLYEFLVIDPVWPKRPGIIQSRNGGVSRARF